LLPLLGNFEITGWIHIVLKQNVICVQTNQRAGCRKSEMAALKTIRYWKTLFHLVYKISGRIGKMCKYGCNPLLRIRFFDGMSP